VFFNHIQRNSLIGQGEVKTQNSPKTAPARRLPGGLRPLIGVLALTVCTLAPATREPAFVQVADDSMVTATTGVDAFQRADIIDDIIDVIDKIINPPPPPPPNEP
jgi:hypothetical protein